MNFINWFLWGVDKPTKEDKAIVRTVAFIGLGAVILCFGVSVLN